MDDSQDVNVLIVEDREDDAELILHALRRVGFNVRWQRVETREAFLAHLHPELDVILADYTLPQFDGLEALALLKERMLDIPFILISGTIGEEAAVRAMRAGASDYLLKDRLGRLPAAVRAVMREKSLRRERRQASEALQQSEERYRRLVEHSPAPIAVHVEGKFVYVNPATVALLGAEDASDLLGRPVLDVVHEDSQELAMARIRRMQQTGEPEPTVEEKIVRLDGDVIYVEISATPITYRGQPAVQIIGHDITERKRVQEAYQKLVDESLQGILVAQDGRNVFCNQAYADMLGYTTEELLSFSAEEAIRHIHPSDRSRVTGYYHRRMAGEPAPTRYEYRIVRKDGDVRWLHASVSPTEYKGRPAAQAYYVDITERRQAEEAERKQRRYAEALADTASVLNSSLEPETVLERLLANVGRVLPHDAADVLLLEDGVARVAGSVGYDELGLKKVVEAIVLLLDRTPTLQRIARTAQPLITPDIEKSTLWVGQTMDPLRSVLGAPILIDDEVVGVINILSRTPNAFSERDAERLKAFAHQAAIALRNARLYQQLEHHSEILEETVAERTAELRQTKESVEAILDAIGEGVIVLDAEGRIIQVNPALEAQTGYRQAELVGRTYAVLLPGTDIDDSLAADILQMVQEGKSWRGGAALRRRNGTTFDAALTVTPMRQEQGEPGAYVVSVRDITQMKKVERMKDSVLSIAAHELRTPLTTMRLFSDLLLNRPPDDEERRRHSMGIIYQQTVQLQKIVDDMLDLARLEAGRGLKIVPEPVNLRELVEEVVQPMAQTTDEHEFDLRDVSPRLAVRGDRTRLVQVLRNLLSNAVKYSPEGGAITLRAREKEGQVEISVEDEGVGMTAEQQQHLFQKFYRADTGSGSPRGTGLGLAICKLIVEGHGGRIWAESEKGVGSTFTFRVPAGASDNEAMPG